MKPSNGRVTRIVSFFALGCVVSFIFAPPVQPQETRLDRTFSPGKVDHYRVRLTIRSELKGQEPVQRGEAVYLQAFARSGEGRLEWHAAERVAAVAADGSADIEETLSHFTIGAATELVPAGGASTDHPLVAGPDDERSASGANDGSAAQKLTESIVGCLGHWANPGRLVLHYRETRQGELRISPGNGAGAPKLDEAAPTLLTLWLVRALRPTAWLPANLRVGTRWQEPRAVTLEGWSGVHGLETSEWLAAEDAPESAMRLLVVQQIAGTVVAGPEKPPEGSAQGTFHGELLATVAINDGSLIQASRSAARELSWKLAPTAGLIEPPEFRTRLSAEVQIERCIGPCAP